MTEYNYKHTKTREGTHLKEEIQDYQKELSARDFIRTIGGQKDNPLSLLILVVVSLIVGGTLAVLLTQNRQNVVPTSNSSAPSVPSVSSPPGLPSIAPYP